MKLFLLDRSVTLKHSDQRRYGSGESGKKKVAARERDQKKEKKKRVYEHTRLVKRARKVVLVKLQQLPNFDSTAREKPTSETTPCIGGATRRVKIGERGWLYICIREHSGVNQESRPFDFGVRKSDFFRKNLRIHSRRHQWKKYEV